MAKAIFGVFRKRSEIRAAQRALRASGYSKSSFSTLYPLHQGPQDFPHRQRSTIELGAMIGAVIGGLIFLILGVILNLRLVPVTNPLVFVFGMCLGGMAFGGAAGALIGIGTPQPASLRYGDYVDSGGILMSVHVEDVEQERLAKSILEKAGAQDIQLLDEGRDWKTVYSKVVQKYAQSEV